MSQLDIEHWIARRTFTDVRICQNAVSMLSEEADSTVDTAEVVKLMTQVTNVPYTEVDVRMIMGTPTTPEETEAVLRISKIIRTLTDVPNRQSAIALLHEQNIDDHWIGYCESFMKATEVYLEDSDKLLKLYIAALSDLPPPPTLEGQTDPDYTVIVGFPGNPSQPDSMGVFIDAMLDFFQVRPGVQMVPQPDLWTLREYIVLRVTVVNDMPIVTIPSPKGTIVLNAAPVE